MRRFFFFLFLCAGLCAAAGAQTVLAAEPITSDGLLSILYDNSVSLELDPGSVSGNDVNIDVSTRPLDEDWDVMYYDYLDPGGNPYTTKITKFLDGKTLYVSREDYPGGLQTFASYTTYYGLLSTSYVDLFKGLAAKLHITEHYVCARTGQYEYIFAHGDDLSLTGTTFRGSNVRVYSYYTNNNGYFTVSDQASFTLNGQNYIVYSDLGKDYPSLLSNSEIYSRLIFFLLGIVVIGYFINSFFGKGVVTNALRKSKKREVY